MSRLLFCTAKIVNVDKNAESQDEMRKNGSILNGVDDDFSIPFFLYSQNIFAML